IRGRSFRRRTGRRSRASRPIAGRIRRAGRALARVSRRKGEGGQLRCDCPLVSRGQLTTLRVILGASVEDSSSGTMDSSTWAFLLLAIGLTLLVAEVFIPSGGVITVLAALCLVGALIYAGSAWWTSNPAYFWGFATLMIFLLPVILTVAFYIWPSTPLG